MPTDYQAYLSRLLGFFDLSPYKGSGISDDINPGSSLLAFLQHIDPK